VQAGKNCLKGFSVQGRIEKARRNYTQMWEQIGSYRKKEGAAALSNFRLNILGEVVEYFAVPGEGSCLKGVTPAAATAAAVCVLTGAGLIS
jgi:DNA-binding ferritin-like protein (Dps family)